MEHIPDWSLLWKQLSELKITEHEKFGDENGDIWAKKARSFDNLVKKRWNTQDSSRRFVVDLLKANPGSTLLDIGAGTGSWACMLAPYAAKITALEPSSAMSAVMEENLRKLGITNVEIVRNSWPDAVVKDHDFSLCSHAMYGCTDLTAFVKRMDDVTRRCSLLLMRAPVPGGIMYRIAQEVLGQPYDSPNFQICYNILLQMGIFANVLMEDTGLTKPWTNTSMEEAIADVKRRLGLVGDDRHDAFIIKILQQELTWKDGKFLWPAGVCSALVYWYKQA